MKPIILVPLVALALAVGSAGAYFWLSSEGSVEETVIAQPTPTPEPTQPPSGGGGVGGDLGAATVVPPPAPAEEGKAPGGCSAGELAYVDPDGRFAFCYPADMELVTVDTGEGIAPTVMHALGEEKRVVVNVGWAPQRRSISGEACIDSPYLIQNQKIEDFLIGGRAVQACFQDHYDRDDAGNPTTLVYQTIEMEVPVANGFIHVDAAYFGGAEAERNGTPVKEMALRLLNSAAIY